MRTLKANMSARLVIADQVVTARPERRIADHRRAAAEEVLVTAHPRVIRQRDVAPGRAIEIAVRVQVRSVLQLKNAMIAEAEPAGIETSAVKDDLHARGIRIEAVEGPLHLVRRQPLGTDERQLDVGAVRVHPTDRHRSILHERHLRVRRESRRRARGAREVQAVALLVVGPVRRIRPIALGAPARPGVGRRVLRHHHRRSRRRGRQLVAVRIIVDEDDPMLVVPLEHSRRRGPNEVIRTRARNLHLRDSLVRNTLARSVKDGDRLRRDRALREHDGRRREGLAVHGDRDDRTDRALRNDRRGSRLARADRRLDVLRFLAVRCRRVRDARIIGKAQGAARRVRDVRVVRFRRRTVEARGGIGERRVRQRPGGRGRRIRVDHELRQLRRIHPAAEALGRGVVEVLERRFGIAALRHEVAEHERHVHAGVVVLHAASHALHRELRRRALEVDLTAARQRVADQAGAARVDRRLVQRDHLTRIANVELITPEQRTADERNRVHPTIGVEVVEARACIVLDEEL